jgi:hypothetical protein
MTGTPEDPRSEAEKARADLKRNAEISGGATETPLTHQPSVTPDTFGERWDKARVLSGSTQGVEAGGARPPAGSGSRSQSLAEGPQESVGRDQTRPVTDQSDEDAPSGAKDSEV